VVGQSGCQLAATITTDSAGSSDPTVLGRLIRLPRMEKFALTDEKLSPTLYAGNLTGIDLQSSRRQVGCQGGISRARNSHTGTGQQSPGTNVESRTSLATPVAPRTDLRLAARRNDGRLTDVKY